MYHWNPCYRAESCNVLYPLSNITFASIQPSIRQWKLDSLKQASSIATKTFGSWKSRAEGEQANSKTPAESEKEEGKFETFLVNVSLEDRAVPLSRARGKDERSSPSEKVCHHCSFSPWKIRTKEGGQKCSALSHKRADSRDRGIKRHHSYSRYTSSAWKGGHVSWRQSQAERNCLPAKELLFHGFAGIRRHNFRGLIITVINESSLILSIFKLLCSVDTLGVICV